jgi:hypothetical protein
LDNPELLITKEQSLFTFQKYIDDLLTISASLPVYFLSVTASDHIVKTAASQCQGEREREREITKMMISHFGVWPKERKKESERETKKERERKTEK